MREIKFRAWRPRPWGDIGPHVVYFDLFQVECDESYRVSAEGMRLDGADIEQYTGLKDRKGTEIYDGDIVEMTYWTNGGRSGKAKKWPAVISWLDYHAGFYATPKAGLPLSYRVHFNTFAESEVIGNVHENPELL